MLPAKFWEVKQYKEKHLKMYLLWQCQGNERFNTTVAVVAAKSSSTRSEGGMWGGNSALDLSHIICLMWPMNCALERKLTNYGVIRTKFVNYNNSIRVLQTNLSIDY